MLPVVQRFGLSPCFLKGAEGEDLHIHTVKDTREVVDVACVIRHEVSDDAGDFCRDQEWAVGGDANDDIEAILLGTLVVAVKDILLIPYEVLLVQADWDSVGRGDDHLLYVGNFMDTIDDMFQDREAVYELQNLVRESGRGETRLYDAPYHCANSYSSQSIRVRAMASLTEFMGTSRSFRHRMKYSSSFTYIELSTRMGTVTVSFLEVSVNSRW